MKRILDAVLNKGTEVVIDGKHYSGRNVVIEGNGKVFVDGQVVDSLDDRLTVNVHITGSVEVVETMAGDITVEGDVKRAKTMSGDVFVKGTVGKASTMSGDINSRP